MPEKTVKIVNRKGLHARSAAQLVAEAQTYDCRIELTTGGKSADCASMMNLMMLAAGLGSDVCVRTDGPDEQSALEAICALIEAGFHEGE